MQGRLLYFNLLRIKHAAYDHKRRGRAQTAAHERVHRRHGIRHDCRHVRSVHRGCDSRVGTQPGELGELPEGKIPGRQDDRQVTLYQSHGINAQDLFAAKDIYGKALTSDQGVTIDF